MSWICPSLRSWRIPSRLSEKVRCNGTRAEQNHGYAAVSFIAQRVPGRDGMLSFVMLDDEDSGANFPAGVERIEAGVVQLDVLQLLEFRIVRRTYEQ